MTSNPFPILVERFFTDHLRTQRNVSPLTIEAYSDTFRILLKYLAERHRQTIDRLTFREFGAKRFWEENATQKCKNMQKHAK